jgi:hypothetical protein
MCGSVGTRDDQALTGTFATTRNFRVHINRGSHDTPGNA